MRTRPARGGKRLTISLAKGNLRQKFPAPAQSPWFPVFLQTSWEMNSYWATSTLLLQAELALVLLGPDREARPLPLPSRRRNRWRVGGRARIFHFSRRQLAHLQMSPSANKASPIQPQPAKTIAKCPRTRRSQRSKCARPKILPAYMTSGERALLSDPYLPVVSMSGRWPPSLQRHCARPRATLPILPKPSDTQSRRRKRTRHSIS